MYVSACRVCHSGKLHKFLDLGKMPPADQFLLKSRLPVKEDAYPLEAVVCDDCGLVQLSYVVPPEILYCNEYPYEASITAAGRRHWNEFAETAKIMLGLTSSDLVIDIGSNVGFLLQMFKDRDMRVLGIDPAANIAAIANRHGIETLPIFFDEAVAARVRSTHGRASLITGTNVFAHIDDLHGFMRAVDLLLKDDGALVIEAPYLIDLLQVLEYDTIYHEHLSYLSLKPLLQFFASVGMQLFDVQRRDIHGGSLRVFVQRAGRTTRPVSSIIDELVGEEEREKIYSHDRLSEFADQVANNREVLRFLLLGMKSRGKRIAAVSAPAKGMTLLNYCGLGADIIDFVTEKSKLKIGRVTPGTHIPVAADEMLYERRPDFALLLAWNFAEEIMANLKRFSDHGGKFIIPIPNPKIVG